MQVGILINALDRIAVVPTLIAKTIFGIAMRADMNGEFLVLGTYRFLPDTVSGRLF